MYIWLIYRNLKISVIEVCACTCVCIHAFVCVCKRKGWMERKKERVKVLPCERLKQKDREFEAMLGSMEKPSINKTMTQSKT